MIRKLRIGIVCIIMALAMLLFLVLDISLHLSTRTQLRQQSYDTLEEALQLSAYEYDEYAIELGTESSAKQAFFVINVSPNKVPTAVYFGSFALDNALMMRQIARRATETDDRYGDLQDLSLRYAKKKMLVGWRVVCVDIRQEQQLLKNLHWTLASITLVGLAVFYGLAWCVAVITTQPVAESMQRQQQLIADVSHELKTPLTVILSSIDMLRSRPDATKDQIDRWQDGIRSEAMRMKNMTEELLILARGDSRRNALPQTEVDLSDLVSNELLRFDPLFFEEGLALDWQVQKDLHIIGNEVDLKKLTGILLDNALKYTVSGGSVSVSLSREDAHNLLLQVASDGDTLSPEELKRLFDRFYRVDPARSGSDRGHGLGLSIAKTIAQEHRSQIWAESKNGCNRFFVRFPCSTQA